MGFVALDDLLLDRYGLDGHLQRLDGDVDENWRLRSKESSYLVKVSRGASRTTLAHTASILTSLQQLATDVPVEKVQETIQGTHLAETTLAGTDVSVRVTNFMPGTPLSTKNHTTLEEIESLGATLAQLDEALASLTHAVDPLAHEWQLESLSTKKQLSDLPLSTEVCARLEQYLAEEWPLTHNALRTLPQQLIHNDCDGDNVLVWNGKVSEVLDFGDMSNAPQIVDFAVTAAYVDAKWQEQELTGAYIRSYKKHSSISEEQLHLLGRVVHARNALRTVNAALGAKQHPNNAQYRLRNIEAASEAFMQHDHNKWEGMIA